ncbi:hypothetical protein EC988_009022, partial [Linderina pennispora]
QHPYSTPAHVPVAQSLQNTPLMRPYREGFPNEGFELPPINFSAAAPHHHNHHRAAAVPQQHQHQQQSPPAGGSR